MISLHAGIFDVMYQNGFLRYIRHGGYEAVRMIYFALRDEHWGTDHIDIRNEKISSTENSFSVEYDCFHYRGEQILFEWKVSICGTPSSEIVFDIHGRALCDFQKNRIGFCVLHPVKEMAGNELSVQHTDGQIEEAKFPYWIAANNPFKNISAFYWSGGGRNYSLQLEGESFEMEDQRNWTDASFKTFCTPLDLPFPVTVKNGELISQKIILRSFAMPAVTATADANLEQFERWAQLPAIGVSASTETDLLSERDLGLIRELKFHHYRIDVRPDTRGWQDRFKIDCNNARSLQIPVELVAHLSEEALSEEADDLMKEILRCDIKVASLLLLTRAKHTTRQAVIDHAGFFKERLPLAKIGAGTDFNFAELNRNRFDAGPLDFISFAVQPQEHAFDDLSLVETLGAQADVVRSAANLYPDKEIHISPITLRKRFNPYATDPVFRVLSAAQRADPRQMEKFCAAWTLGSIKQMTLAGANSITLFQTVGAQGLLNDRALYPVYDALRELMSYRHEKVLYTQSAEPLQNDELLFSDGYRLQWEYQ